MAVFDFRLVMAELYSNLIAVRKHHQLFTLAVSPSNNPTYSLFLGCFCLKCAQVSRGQRYFKITGAFIDVVGKWSALI